MEQTGVGWGLVGMLSSFIQASKHGTAFHVLQGWPSLKSTNPPGPGPRTPTASSSEDFWVVLACEMGKLQFLVL